MTGMGDVGWWFLFGIAYVAALIFILLLLTNSSRRDDAAIEQHEIDTDFRELTESMEHDIRWDDEND